MAIKKDIVLPNGIKTNYHVISSIEVSNEKIAVFLDNFTDKSYYDLACKRQELLNKQKELEIEFDTLNNKDNLTKTQQTRLEKLVTEINNIADEVEKCKEYNKYVVLTLSTEIPFIDNFSEANIEKELKKLKLI